MRGDFANIVLENDSVRIQTGSWGLQNKREDGSDIPISPFRVKGESWGFVLHVQASSAVIQRDLAS